MKLVKTYLEDRKIRHLESNLPVINVAQLFMHDPDNHMIEFCACEDVTVRALGLVKDSYCGTIIMYIHTTNKLYTCKCL
jgi:hypothetical protein